MSRRSQHFAFALLLVCSGCKSVANSDTQGTLNTGAKGGSSDDSTQGGSGGTSEQTGTNGAKPSGSTGSGGDKPGDQPAGGGKGGTNAGGSDAERDAALPPDEQPGQHDPDAGTMVEIPDGAVLGDAMVGSIGTESCCTVHDSPGCSNADLQVCVCEKISTCCTDKWDEACVLIVEQRWCQEGVRDCVCLDGDNQWGQHVCCDSSWGSTCDTTARTHCGAKRGCF
jgi:hypothetical protein